MSSQQVTPDPRYSHPMRKYDKRADNGNFESENKRGPKPKGRKDLAGRRAITELRKMDGHKKPSDMFKEAIDAHNYALAWSIRTDVETRALGRPYVAVNPDAERHDQADISRIAVAINNLQIVNNAKQDAKPGRVLEAKVSTGEITPLVATESEFSPNPPSNTPEPIQAGAKATPVR